MKIAKRSLAQCVHSPSVDRGSIAMASPAGFGLAGRAATCTEVRNSNPSGVRESNRVSNWVFRMVAVLAVLLNGSMFVYAAPIKFLKSVPENESLINSFDFTLEFDISEALEIAATEKPGIVYGLGYMGSSSLNATLYKGDVETGTIIGQVNSSNFTGKSNGFKDNGNTIQVSFDSTLPIIANQEYTVVITNKFYLYQSGKITRLASTEADFSSDPITLKFKGQSSEKPQLDIISSNIGDDALASISQIEFKLNSAFQINSGAEVFICEGDKIVAKTSDLIVSSTDNKVLVAHFNDVPLLLGHSYTIELPDNSLTHVDDSTVGNFVYKVNVNGSQTYKIALTSSKVDVDSNGIPTSVTFIYDLPEGSTLDGLNFTGCKDGLLSIDGSEDSTNLNTKCSFIQNGKGLKWDLSSVKFEPATKYNFRKDGNTLVVFDANNSNISTGLLKEYSGEDASISFVTPSIDEGGYSEMEFENPTINKESAYTPNMPCSTLSNIKFGLKDHFYYVDNKEYALRIHPDFPDETKACQLYEVSENDDRLLNSFSVGLITDESSTRVWYIANINMSAYLYEGKNYKVVIPEGYFTAAPRTNPGELSKANYIKSKEIILTFTGSTPTEAVLKNCSIANNEKINALYNVVWTFEGNYQLSDENSQAQLVIMRTGLPATVPTNRPVIVSSNGKETYVMIDFVSKSTGKPVYLNSNTSYKLTLPKGMLINVNNNDIVNDEVVLTIVGKDEEAGLQKVNVNLSVNGLHATAHKAVKGEAYTFHFNPAAEWVVESVQHGDKELAPNANDSYTTEPLIADADITAHLKYNGLWAFEDTTTGIWSVENTNIRIFRDGDKIVVEGITPDNNINVYNIGGLIVNSGRVTDGKDKTYISVPKGQIYIVTVDGVAAKIQL